MSLLNKLTLKNLKLNKKRTRVTILGIILSVALITSVANIFSSLKATMTEDTIENYGDFHYYFENVPSTDLKYFQENRNIEKIYLTKHLGYTDNLDERKYIYFIEVKALTEDAFNNLGIELVSGRLPQNSHEIILDSRATIYKDHKYKIGDEITYDLGTLEDEHFYDDYKLANDLNASGARVIPDSEEETIIDYNIINRKPTTYKIVGIYNRSSNKLDDICGYVNLTKLEEDNLNGNYNLFVRYTKKGLKKQNEVTANLINYDLNIYEDILNKSEDILFKFRDSFKKEYQDFFNEVKYVPYYNGNLITIETNWLKNTDLKPIAAICAVIALIIIITSILCIKNSFDISVTEKVRQYGMLSSIGATKKQIRHSIYYEALLLCLASIPLGLLAGYGISYLLLTINNNVLKDVYESNIIFQVSIEFVILSIFLSIITVFLSSLKSAFKASKLDPIEAIRNNEKIKVKKGSLKVPSIITKLFGVGGNISYKNLRRNRKKYRPTIISLVICLILFISVSYFVNLLYDAYLSEYDINYNMLLSIEQSEMENIDEVYALDSIKEYSNITTYSVYVINYPVSKDYENYHHQDYMFSDYKCNNSINNSKSIMAFKVGEDEYKRYIKKLGLKYEDMKDKAILIDSIVFRSYNPQTKKEVRDYYHELDYGVGDKLTIYPDEFDCETETTDLTISYPIEIGHILNMTLKNKVLPLGLNSYFDKQNNSALILSDELFDKLYPTVKDYRIFINSKDPSTTEKEIKSILGPSAIYDLNNYEQQLKDVKGTIIVINIFLYSFIIIVLLISMTNIFNTITTSIEMRQKEFAMLKSVGMSNKEFNKMISLESIFIGIKSLVIGLIIGWLLSYVIYNKFMDYNFYSKAEIPYQLPYFSMIIAIIAIIVILIIIIKYSLDKAKKQNIIETIRKENI